MTPPHFLRATLLFVATTAQAAEPVPRGHATDMAASARLFADQVRPYLTQHCLECHGAGKLKSGFSLATREFLLQGGDKGPAAVPGKGRDSRLVHLITHRDEPHMPPKKPAAAKDIVDAIVRWIDLGAAYDRPLAAATAPSKTALIITDKDRQYWAYRALAAPRPPAVKNAAWPVNDIDRFVLARLEAAGLTPAVEADRRILIRRVTFDLTGLPPTPEEVAAFVAAPDLEKAYSAVVDRLLESPHFGERWARHWLDPARFAESHGFEHDYPRPHAYHYRDFVIKAFNQDLPYDQFVHWQIAGDELAPENPLALAATGFLGAGVYPTQITTREAERVRYDAMDDMLATTGNAILALTVGCARCHDHKYDPIPTRDYYQLLTAFTTTVRSEIDWDFGTDEEKRRRMEFEAKLQPLAAARKQFEDGELPKRFQAWLGERKAKQEALPTIADAKVRGLVQGVWEGKKPFDQLKPPEREAVLGWFKPQVAEWRDLDAKVKEAERGRPKDTRAKMQICTEGLKPMRHHTADGSIPDFYPETFYLKRGDAAQKDGAAPQGFLQVLMRAPDGPKAWLATKPEGARTSFRRAGLARWLTDVRSGAGSLAARVIVNRLWHHHFGRGLVASVNDFGFQGDTPTHPELLEWLATDLTSHDWRLKRLHKLLVTSRTYRLSGAVDAEARRADPDNRLWGHRPRRRLEAEAVRDNLLAVSGQLDRTMYGPGTLDEGMKRRSIYFTVYRSRLIPMLQVFDWPDTLTSTASRPTTVVAPQALLFLNNPQVRTWSSAFAARLKSESGGDPRKLVERAYALAFGRPPSEAEARLGRAFLGGRPTADDYAQAILGLNEFIYVE